MTKEYFFETVLPKILEKSGIRGLFSEVDFKPDLIQPEKCIVADKLKPDYSDHIVTTIYLKNGEPALAEVDFARERKHNKYFIVGDAFPNETKGYYDITEISFDKLSNLTKK